MWFQFSDIREISELKSYSYTGSILLHLFWDWTLTVPSNLHGRQFYFQDTTNEYIHSCNAMNVIMKIFPIIVNWKKTIDICVDIGRCWAVGRGAACKLISRISLCIAAVWLVTVPARHVSHVWQFVQCSWRRHLLAPPYSLLISAFTLRLTAI